MKAESSRFECPSLGLRLASLLRGAERAIWVASVLAIAFHLAATVLRGAGETKVAARPLTTRFVKRAPRLTKPLDMRKRPRPRQRAMRREMVSVKARGKRGPTTSRTLASQVVRSLSSPTVSLSGFIAIPRGELEPSALAGQILGAREPERKMDMSLEMLGVESLDTGEYHALVIQNPHDKRDIKGFFHLAGVYSRGMDREQQLRNFGVPNGAIRVLPNIVVAVNKYTDIEATLGRAYCLDSRELLRIPWSLITSHYVFELPASEARNLGTYLRSGGFLFADDDSITRGHDGDVGLRNMFRDALATAGKLFERDWNFEELPHSHAMYHCYFDFDGPPAGNDVVRGWWTIAAGHVGIHEPYELDGIHIDGRMVGIMSNKDYTEHWLHEARDMKNNVRQMQFTVNTIIFALTQEGSITQQLAEGMRNW